MTSHNQEAFVMADAHDAVVSILIKLLLNIIIGDEMKKLKVFGIIIVALMMFSACEDTPTGANNSADTDDTTTTPLSLDGYWLVNQYSEGGTWYQFPEGAEEFYNFSNDSLTVYEFDNLNGISSETTEFSISNDTLFMASDTLNIESTNNYVDITFEGRTYRLTEYTGTFPPANWTIKETSFLFGEWLCIGAEDNGVFEEFPMNHPMSHYFEFGEEYATIVGLNTGYIGLNTYEHNDTMISFPRYNDSALYSFSNDTLVFTFYHSIQSSIDYLETGTKMYLVKKDISTYPVEWKISKGLAEGEKFFLTNISTNGVIEEVDTSNSYIRVFTDSSYTYQITPNDTGGVDSTNYYPFSLTSDSIIFNNETYTVKDPDSFSGFDLVLSITDNTKNVTEYTFKKVYGSPF